MDIQLPKRTPWRTYLALSAALLLLCYGVYFLSNPAIPSVSTQDYPIQQVQQSDIQLTATALGELFASEQLLLTAPAAGTVVAIQQRPGALVNADSVILRLDNPELDLKVQAAASQLKKLQAEFMAFQAQQQSALLDQQGELAELTALRERAALELNLISALRERGVAATVELQRASLQLQQQQQKLDFGQQKLVQFRQLQAAELTQQQEQLKLAADELELLQKQQQKMLITAKMAGLLQQLDVELGQNVLQGASLARVGSQQKLSARIYINQRQADQISIGTPVTIDSRRGLLNGHIQRIEAVVVNGTVAAEVSLPDQLPAGLRPSLQITASVQLGKRPQALSIRQTGGLLPNTTQRVFVLDDAGMAHARQVQFGELNNQQLLIEKGLQAGERFIVLPQDLWPDQPLLRLQHSQ